MLLLVRHPLLQHAGHGAALQGDISPTKGAGLGFMGGAAAGLIGGVIAAIAVVYFIARKMKLTSPRLYVGLFWAAFVTPRPFGATFGDVLARPLHEGGGLRPRRSSAVAGDPRGHDPLRHYRRNKTGPAATTETGGGRGPLSGVSLRSAEQSSDASSSSRFRRAPVTPLAQGLREAGTPWTRWRTATQADPRPDHRLRRDRAGLDAAGDRQG